MPSQAYIQRILLLLNEQIQWSVQLFYIYLLIARGFVQNPSIEKDLK